MFSSSKWKQTNTNEFYTEGQIASVIKSCDIKIGGEIESHFLIFCPFHYNINTPACEIDKTNGMFICFSCGEAGSIVDIVMRTTNRNYFEALRLINSYKNNFDINYEIETIFNKDTEIQEFDIETINRLHNELLENINALNYFYSRNITDESITKFKLGYSSKQNMVIVPVFDVDGMCLGFVARSIEGKSFKNSTGLPKSKVLFNLNRSKRNKVVVVESSFDAIRLSQVGIAAVATLGATVSRQQISLLESYATSIVICPDNDDAGMKLIEKITSNIKNKEVNIIKLNKGKDIGDLNDIEIKELFNSYGNSLILAV